MRKLVTKLCCVIKSNVTLTRVCFVVIVVNMIVLRGFLPEELNRALFYKELICVVLITIAATIILLRNIDWLENKLGKLHATHSWKKNKS